VHRDRLEGLGSMSKTSARKLPLWKVIVFSLTPALVLFVLIEGAARIVWAHYQAEAFARGINKVINFVQVPDAVVGYRLAPNYENQEGMFTGSIGRFSFKFPMHFHTNANGYMQREEVASTKQKDSLRIVAVGESTTQGHHVDQSYPSVLRNLIRSTTNYPGGAEVINAGVQGYISDQWTLLAERELAALRPDIVVLYAGWNDFQSYNPHLEPPKNSRFENPLYHWTAPSHWLRSVTLLNAYLQRRAATPETYGKEMKTSEPQTRTGPSVQTEAEHIRALYKFFLLNLDRTVAAFRKENKDVRIVISTLVGRWPYESEKYFRDGQNSVWWMKTDKDKDDSKTAYEHLGRFNDLIRDYAKENGLVLIDSANRFENVNREEIMWDFCHFTDVGYRMLAETIFNGLRDQGLLKWKG
jgi:lysophospholipase L1-like esterase